MPETATLADATASTSLGPLTVPTWPRFTAVISEPSAEHSRVTIEMKFIGKPKTKTAPTAYLARAMILSAAASRAAEINRPIMVNVNPDSADPLRLAVRPSGIVQEVDEDNRIGDSQDLLPAEFPCFICFTKTTLIGACVKCEEERPFEREVPGKFLDHLTPEEEPLAEMFPDAEILPAVRVPKPAEKYRFRKRYIPLIIVASIGYAVEVIGGGFAVIYVLLS